MGAKAKVHRNHDVVTSVGRGRSQVEVALEHDISPSRVWYLCNQAGVTNGYRMTHAEIEKAKANFRKTKSVAEAARKIDRSTWAVAEMLVRCGLHTRWSELDKWTDKEDGAIIKGYYRDGSRKVAAQLKRTRNEVIGRANRLKKLGKLTPPKEVY